MGVERLAHSFRGKGNNKNFRNVLLYYIGASSSHGILTGLNIMAWTYYWELSASQVFLILWLPSVLAVPLAVLATGPLVQAPHFAGGARPDDYRRGVAVSVLR